MKQAAIAFSKLRNEIGLVGIDANPEKKTVTPKLAQQWTVNDVETMASDTYALHQRYNWGTTFIEQESGEYLISILKNQYKLPIKVITTGKKIKDPKSIRKVRIMDKNEMTEYLRKLKLNGQLLFVKSPSAKMKELEEQIPFFTKHATEAGSIDYYASGKEPDNLVKALMIACFSVRNILEGNDGSIVAGPIDTALNMDITTTGNEFEDDFTSAFPASGDW